MSNFNLAPDFRATGKGYANKWGTAATPVTGNLRMTNLGLPNNHPQRELYAFCTGFSTGWGLSGAGSQSADGRYFYPRHMSQTDVAFSIVFPSQYEYDRWVEFAQVHHKTSLRANGGIRVNKAGVKQGGYPVVFKLRPFRFGAGKNKDGSQKYIYVHEAEELEGYISTVKAGHQRFTQAPTADCIVKVTNDFRHEQAVAPVLFNHMLQTQYQGSLHDFNVVQGKQVDNGNNDPLQEVFETTVSAINTIDSIAGAASGFIVDIGEFLS